MPAAGRARRLGELESSKEVLPVGTASTPDGPRPRAVCEHLLEGFRLAGIERALVVLRSGKWDIPEILGDGSRWGLHLAYRVIEHSRSVPETLAAALPFLGPDTRVALGFPDILFQPHHAFAPVLDRLDRTGADAVLAAVPCRRPEKSDMIEIERTDETGGRVSRFVIKQPDQGLHYGWSLAAWSPRLTAHLARFVEAHRDAKEEPHVGNLFTSAIAAGLRIEAEIFDDGGFLDVGTPDDLARARMAR